MGPEKKRRYSRTAIYHSQYGFLVQRQGLARVMSVLRLGLPLTLSCFRAYTDKKIENLFRPYL